MSGAKSLKRRGLQRHPVIDGTAAPDHALNRLKHRIDSLLVSRHEREEASLERRLRVQPGVTRPNLLALASPKGGVGKTTATFLTGNLLASHLKLRAIAVDASRGFGTLGLLANDRIRVTRSLADLLEDIDRIGTAAELRPYVTRLPTGLHLLAAPPDIARTTRLAPDHYGELVALLSCFYETVLLDLGTGLTSPVARFAIHRADQVVLVTMPEALTADLTLAAIDHLGGGGGATVVVNKAHPTHAPELHAIEECLRLRDRPGTVAIPHDRRLAAMLDTGTYSLEALDRRTRLPVKRLGLAVAEQLV